MRPDTSFSNIYRVLRLLGTASAVTTLLTLARNKGFAMFLGPSGFGLLGLLQTFIGTAANIGGLGIGYSTIRMISCARSRQYVRMVQFFEMSLSQVGRHLAAYTACVTALILAIWNLWNDDVALTAFQITVTAAAAGISILASVTVIVIQTRRLTRQLATVSVLAATLHTATSVPIAAWLGDAGIAIIAALVPLSVWITASLALKDAGAPPPSPSKPRRRDRIVRATIVQRGAPLMVPSLIESLGSFFVRMLGAGAMGLAALGQVYAALALAAFVLSMVMSAMNQDFLPRLGEAAGDRKRLYHLASEQLQVTLNLAAPVLLVTCIFSADLARAMFSAEFAQTADLVPLMALLVVAQIANWPIQTIQTTLGFAMQQVIGTITSLTTSLLVAALSFPSMTPMDFATALVAGAAAQCVAQGVLLWQSAGIRYGRKEWMPMILLIAFVILFTVGRERDGARAMMAMAALGWTGIAFRHFLRHRG